MAMGILVGGVAHISEWRGRAAHQMLKWSLKKWALVGSGQAILTLGSL